MNFSVLTINVAGIQFDWFEGRRDVLVEQIKSLSPDIIFIQEATVVLERKYDQITDIMKGAGLTCSAFCPYLNEREFESPKLGGIGIISRWPFQFVQSRKLPPSKLETFGSRSILAGAVVIEGKNLLLCTTHLSYHKEEESIRARQADECVKFIDFYGFKDVIFGGDFNAPPSESCMLKLKDSFKDNGPDGKTFKDRKIDYLLSSEGIELVKSEVVLISKNNFPSDHSGILAQYSF